MEVTFYLEDGSGVSNATSYISLDEAKQIYFDNGYSFGTFTDDVFKRYLNQATSWLDNNYRRYYTGIRQYDDQNLEWPRSSAYYATDSFLISENTVPEEIKNAVVEVSYLIASGEDISPIISKSGQIKEYEVEVDVIKEKTVYTDGSTLYKDVYTIVDEVLSRLVGEGGSRFQIKAIRVGGESP